MTDHSGGHELRPTLRPMLKTAPPSIQAWPCYGLDNKANSAFHPSRAGKWVAIHVIKCKTVKLHVGPLNSRLELRMAAWTQGQSPCMRNRAEPRQKAGYSLSRPAPLQVCSSQCYRSARTLPAPLLLSQHNTIINSAANNELHHSTGDTQFFFARHKHQPQIRAATFGHVHGIIK